MSIFKNTGALRPGKSTFDLSYENKLTCDMGQLIPVQCDEVVPGDLFIMGNRCLARMMPLVAPVMHPIDLVTHTFFVPYRILWPETQEGEPLVNTGWESFITGGIDGDLTPILPRWEPTDTTIGSLWDYFGFPTGVDPDGAYPIDFPRRAYNMIYNEYYRDQNLIDKILETNETVLIRRWTKDYFTSALLEQQRGTAPALPITGTVPVTGINGDITVNNTADATARILQLLTTTGNIGASTAPSSTANARWVNPQLEADLSTASTFDIADIRLAFQIQKWMERNNRAGARYTEFLRAHFGVNPRDDRLQRPEYIGGTKSPLIISEVLQTSESDGTPQGNLAGHGITVTNGMIGKYHAKEFGLIMTILSIMPKPVYQQGINRQWLRRTKYDYYFPEFCNLSEQAIETAEIFASDVDTENLTLFGYQGRYDEMRVKNSMVTGLMRTDFDHWHISRQFIAAPTLDQTFIECVPRKDIFAVPSEPGFILNYGNMIKAIRPLPISAEPGLIDHN